MGDYPDYTTLMQIIGSDIMVPIDVQGAYIMMPVDIQAQYVTLAIDIVAQTVGNIAIDLVAQSIGNIAIDINAQTIGNINIDIDTQSIGVHTEAEWEIVAGNSKYLTGETSELAAYLDTGDYGVIISYSVPSGKTLYIYGFGFAIRPYTAANGSKTYRYGQCRLMAGTTDLVIGGNGGANAYSFACPVKVATGVTVSLRIRNLCDFTMQARGSILAFEI